MRKNSCRRYENYQWIDARRVNQICNESSKAANPLYNKLGPSLPESFCVKAISKKNILIAYQALILIGFSQNNLKYHIVVY